MNHANDDTHLNYIREQERKFIILQLKKLKFFSFFYKLMYFASLFLIFLETILFFSYLKPLIHNFFFFSSLTILCLFSFFFFYKLSFIKGKIISFKKELDNLNYCESIVKIVVPEE